MAKLGTNQLHALAFAARNPGWHGFHSGYHTRQVIYSLANRGLVEVDERLDMFRITTAGKEAARYSTKGVK